MKTIVISDCHGDHAGLMAILRATGAIDAEDRRVPDTRVIQLGDLIHGGDPRATLREGVDDVTALRLGAEYCDEILIGNHELPHLYPGAGFPTFGGMCEQIGHFYVALHDARDAGKLVPATSVGDWLLTHAGLLPYWQRHDLGAAGMAENLCRAFRGRIGGATPFALFDGVGRERGGTHARGGMFWCDWSELINASVINPVKQIVGHTPQREGYASSGPYWCCDAGAALSGRVAALVTDDAGATWTPVVVRSRGAAEAA